MATAVQRTVTMIQNKLGEAICENTDVVHKLFEVTQRDTCSTPADTNTGLRAKKIKNLTDNNPVFQPSVSLSKKAELL